MQLTSEISFTAFETVIFIPIMKNLMNLYGFRVVAQFYKGFGAFEFESLPILKSCRRKAFCQKKNFSCAFTGCFCSEGPSNGCGKDADCSAW